MEIDLGDNAISEVQQRILEWGRQNFAPFPWRSAPSPFLGLISEILLQRTRAQNVVSVYEDFAARFPTPEDVVEAGPEELEDMLRPLGLLWRIPLIKALAERIASDGHIPDEATRLMELPGVGPYVSAAYLSFHAGRRGVLIDSNIVRWLARMTGRPFGPETRRKKWIRVLADRVTPHHGFREFNFALLDFTMSICRPHKPLCEECILGPEYCAYGEERLRTPRSAHSG